VRKKLIAVLLALLFGLVIKLFVIDLMLVEGVSMEPNYRPGEMVLVLRAAYGLRLPWGDSYLLRWALPKRGDVVVFRSPSGDLAVKRVAIVAESLAGTEGGAVFFAEGDNLNESWDSRSYGALSCDTIIGRILNGN
jgi:signal peptidase I